MDVISAAQKYARRVSGVHMKSASDALANGRVTGDLTRHRQQQQQQLLGERTRLPKEMLDRANCRSITCSSRDLADVYTCGEELSVMCCHTFKVSVVLGLSARGGDSIFGPNMDARLTYRS